MLTALLPFCCYSFVNGIFQIVRPLLLCVFLSATFCSQWRIYDFFPRGGSTNPVEGRENGDLGAVAP
jgi:hypothetical protein